ncbi:dermonecrotic toxin domain-containing protein [Pseudomonas sp. NPDC012596]|uniref:dermonecrotic toxin domain-containing protein n=1 Tax=Pseudomonas sp. NPDC012596 TaxID=3364419 RepID=UPI003684946A
MPSIDLENPYQQLIERQLPTWGHHASPEQWQTLHETLLPAQGLPADQADWFANAIPDLREAVQASQARLAHSQSALARALKGLKNIVEFAEPLLAQALATDHQLSVPLRTSELIHIRRLFTWQTYVNQHERRSLLEAALHNFEDEVEFSRESSLALKGDTHVEKITVIGKTTLGDSETLVDIALDSEAYTIKPLSLSPADFARTCRSLDLGQRYQAHLASVFAPPQVASLAVRVHQDRLGVAANLAFLRHQISGDALDNVQAFIDESSTLTCSQLSLFGIGLHEVLIIDLGAAGLLLYLPGHEISLRQFANLPALQDQLHDDLQQADFQQRFLAYVPRDQQQAFLNRLGQNLDAEGGASLYLVPVAIDGELFSFLHQDHVARLQHEARQLAVPTADADEQALKRRQAQWESLGLNALMLAGLFVPGVGTLMTAVMVCQLLDEVYDGYQAWSIGDRQLALRHLEAVGLNLALIGGLHVAGKAVPKLFNSALMESLEPVRTAEGTQRLWRPDLATYISDTALPEHLPANAAGQFQHQGRSFIRLDGHLYEQRLDAALDRWRIVHPSDPKAYEPLLEHNGEGAWRAEHEQPHAWSGPRLVRRLSPAYQELADADLVKALQVSGTSEEQVLQSHLGNEPIPEPLAFTLACLRAKGPISAALEQRASQLASDLPLTRAALGLWLPRLASHDSERLLLACLEHVPGWSPDLRLEIRAGGPQGVVLHSIGDVGATERAVVVKSLDGYEAYLGERPAPGVVDQDLCRAVEAALPGTQRLAMDLAVDEGEALRERILTMIANERTALTRRLWGYQPIRWGEGVLRGGEPPRAYSRQFLRPPTVARYRRLYPSASEQEIQAAIQNWRSQGLSPTVEIDRLQDRLQQLRSDLAEWAQPVPNRRRAIQRIENAWRRTLDQGNAFYSLDLSALDLNDEDLAALALPNDFTHIGELNLSGNLAVTTLPAELYERFPALERLKLSRCGVNQIPRVGRPQTLIWLDLERNPLVWDAVTQARFDRLVNLRVLDLSHCPLSRVPDFTALPRLHTVYLTHCGLDELPNGLQGSVDPILLDFSHNPLTVLPEVAAIPQHVARTLRLEGGALSPQVWGQIDAYYQATGLDLLVPDVDYEELLGGATTDQINVWERLPLQYRRDLRALVESDEYLDALPGSHTETWRRLTRMDDDQYYRRRMLAMPAQRLLDPEIEHR